MKDYKLTVKDTWIVSGDQTMNGGYVATQKLLQENLSAIFATNDLMAMGTYRAALEKTCIFLLILASSDLMILNFPNI